MERFWDKVDVKGPDDCWLWTACCTGAGYGQIRIAGVTIYAHRLSWEMANYDIPDGMCVLHTCSGRYPSGSFENRRCVNPEHLYVGSDQDNADDTRRDGKSGKGELSGLAKLTNEKVWEIRKEYRNGGTTHREIANAYGVSQALISNIINRKIWGHI